MPNPTSPTSQPKTKPMNRPQHVEGEGSYEGTKRYNEMTKEYLASGKSDRAAEEAKKAVSGPEGEELRTAEEKAKRHAAMFDTKPDLDDSEQLDDDDLVESDADIEDEDDDGDGE